MTPAHITAIAFGAGVLAALVVISAVLYVSWLHFALKDARSEAEEALAEAAKTKELLEKALAEQDKLRELYLRASGAAWRTRQ